MANWERHERRRHRDHLAVDHQPRRRHSQRRSGESERRRPSLHRDYHSDNERHSDRHYSDEETGISRRVSKRLQQPSPPRINIEVPRVNPDHERRHSAQASPVSPPNPRVHLPHWMTFENRRSSSQMPDPSLTRHSSVSQLFGSRSGENPASEAFNIPLADEHNNLDGKSNNGHIYNGLPLRSALPSGLETSAAAGSRPASIHRQSVASISNLLGPEAYQYDRLGPRDFRLVKILPALTSDIRCEIITHPLNTALEYTAISYAWGDPDDKAEITLEKDVDEEHYNIPRQRVTKSVTLSLHGALHALRHREENVFVWVDSLSINQQDKDELSRQVQLMSEIYGKATAVAIWLGPDCNDSPKALDLMQELADSAASEGSVYDTILDDYRQRDFAALVALFQREYWTRLWVVQEVFIPDPLKISVYCGDYRPLPWIVCKAASEALLKHKSDLEHRFSGSGTEDHGRGQSVLQQQYSFAQVLAYQGPASLLDGTLRILGDRPLLDLMRACRSKRTAVPLDKVYGILGLLPERVQQLFQPVNYKLSVKKLYIDVVDHILSTTHRVDVLRESIHFPLHVGSTNLPSWCPDWSYIPATKSMQSMTKFYASKMSRNGNWKFLDQKRKLEISAIKLDTIGVRGVAVGTLTTSSDYLMAFLNWRTIMLDTIKPHKQSDYDRLLDEFSRTLRLDHVLPITEHRQEWSDICHHIFASLLRDRLPGLLVDPELQRYANMTGILEPSEARQRLRTSFGAHMMGRSFCITKKKQHICMGSGFMAVDDVVVVPLGCDTPIILRPEGSNGYRYVGNIYVHGYMYGAAIEKLNEGKRTLHKYVLH